ncbi:MAG: nickel-dependent lactate racemase, partial [Anaerolineales bacterium]|nr:nickel-dependent lactate racemase [Anaerolineales bacterium]
MIFRLPYGKNDLSVDLPNEWDVDLITPESVPPVNDARQALRLALLNPIGSAPLRDLVRPGDKVGLVFSDITRPTPNHLILPAVLAELERVPCENITLFNALGSHRPNSAEELAGMLGEEIVNKYRIVQNNAFDPETQIHLGPSSFGHQVWLNAEFMACDLKVLTGFIEPHFFAGFSGGGKAVLPGMAGLRTIMDNHCAEMLDHDSVTWGVTTGNPVWEEIREVGLRAGKTFLVNVALNSDKQITRVFAGGLAAAHDAGCAYVKRHAMLPVAQPYDVVITSNSGYPLDLNLYQAVKGMSAAAQIVRPGGAIVIAAECWDGIP